MKNIKQVHRAHETKILDGSEFDFRSRLKFFCTFLLYFLGSTENCVEIFRFINYLFSKCFDICDENDRIN